MSRKTVQRFRDNDMRKQKLKAWQANPKDCDMLQDPAISWFFPVRKSRDPDQDRFLDVNGYMQSFR